MGNLVYELSISLDGRIETKDGTLDFVEPDEEFHGIVNETSESSAGFIYGRRSWEIMDYWFTAEDNPEAPEYEKEFGRIFNRTPKYVCSRTLSQGDLKGDVKLISGDVPATIRKLKEEAEGDLGVCGADLATGLLREGLIDELRLWIHPVWLGEGKMLFVDYDERLDLKLIDQHRIGTGAVLCHYEVGDGGAAGR